MNTWLTLTGGAMPRALFGCGDTGQTTGGVVTDIRGGCWRTALRAAACTNVRFEENAEKSPDQRGAPEGSSSSLGGR